jgi:hypothetical protein
MYYYDQYGWLCNSGDTSRSTDKVPPTETQTLKANWTGLDWVLVTYTAPPAPPAPPPPVWTNYTDLGPFYDRFGAAKMAVLTSADAGVKAIIGDCNIRKWIDMDDPQVASSIAYIASKVPSVTPAIQAAVMLKPVPEKDNFALRKLYFS